MQRFMLKSKIHRATLTATELHYEGSIAVDKLLLDQADILPGEQVHVLNVNNGQRIVTYAIEAPAGSGIISLRGAAARTRARRRTPAAGTASPPRSSPTPSGAASP